MVWVGHRRWTDAQGNDHPVYQHPRYRALIIRKNADDLSDWIERFRFMYAGLGATVGYRPYEIRFPSGAFIRTGHLKDDQAYTKYMGHEYQSTLIEELTQIPYEKWFLQLISSSRSTIPELKAQVFSTTNPGGKGHGWVKKRYVDPAPPNTVFTDQEGINKIFVPAGVEDNPVLIKNDPAYVKRLDAIKHVDEDLYKAWRLGSWDVFAGQAFREWSYEKHVIDGVRNKFEFSLDICDKIITFDWGYRDKAVATWLALTPENRFGFRRVYMYREIVRTETDPEEWAQIIKKFTDVEKVKFMVLPHDCFAHKLTKVTIADIFARDIKINITRGDTMAKGARLNRKAILHRYLSDAPDGQPYMLVHPSCRDFITAVPELQYDEKNVEDIDTTGNDHCLVGETPVLTTQGWKRIDQLDGAKITGYNAEVVKLITEDGEELTCTLNHKIMTPSGWVEAQYLKENSQILWSSLNDNNLTEARPTGYAVNTFSDMANGYIGQYGWMQAKNQYPRDIISTTETTTSETTHSTILSAFQRTVTSAIILPHPQKSSEQQEDETQPAHAERAMTDLQENNGVKRLKEVIRDGKRDKVYDITIRSEPHAFIANGFVVHNSYDSATLGLISIGYSPQHSKILQPTNRVVQTYPTWNTNQFGNVVPPNFWLEMDKRRLIVPQDSEYM